MELITENNLNLNQLKTMQFSILQLINSVKITILDLRNDQTLDYPHDVI